MIIVNNPFGKDPADIDEEFASSRIGRRIRKIREAHGMPLGELAARVGISSDMLQKYENGQRKPKTDRLKLIARVLGVSSQALTDPALHSSEGCMFAFFEMEERHGLSVEKIDNEFYLKFDGGSRATMNEFLSKWYEKKESVSTRMESCSEEEKEALMREYYDWEWTFPDALVWRPSKDDKKKEKEALEKRLKELDDELKNDDE